MSSYQAYVPDYDLIDHLVTDRAEADMLVTVGITRYAQPEFDIDTGDLQAGTAEKVYEGTARIATLSGPLPQAYGEEQTYWQQTMAYIPLATTPVPQVHDRLDVIETRTPSLAGRTYRITDVQRGGQWPASIALSLTGVQPQPSATGEVGSEWWMPSL